MERPYTIMLVAVSLDGKISPRRQPGQANPIGPELIEPAIMARHNAVRAAVDGILVGRNCILLDDSRLTLRDGEGCNPTRVVLDGLAEIPPTARVLGKEAPTVIVVSDDAPANRVQALEARGARIVVAGHGRYVDVRRAMELLRTEVGIERLLVEGGGSVHRSMIAQGLYDEIQLIVCPFVIGGSTSVTPVERSAFWPHGQVPHYRLDKAETLGDYLFVTYKPRNDMAADPADQT
ncbi:MAG: 5-amino-6-(5-phosphoribosylamino)uracil reductase [Gemmatimonadetes bacterium]|nr:5-amino-6-(5-phosphoribosylamino)uracil reductase [Gemmatimonadota bacterium]MBT6147567.1 5-amino-6-(5-phosphoribosylamino)uracil reductase [Gemmatimonadota bacterium]MBT7067704.1 5-amino-6-(5-phosphoribosylamino)uracil reductase [Verrucomicrobiota bacterium]MBT7864013.1 5-amino-6-(5-phosphoribosylamino)uracil reductase [Gemmatimonadota bacterium]